MLELRKAEQGTDVAVQNLAPDHAKAPRGSAPSAEEEQEFAKEVEFYRQWARENVKSSIVLANDVLKQLLTINAALLGAASILLNDNLIDPLGRVATVLAFFLALVVSFLGVLPFESPPQREVAKIRAAKIRALNHKRNLLAGAAGLMSLGFGIAIVGIVLHGR